MKPLIIGTRGSALALWQANYIKQRLWDELQQESVLQIVKTKGDKILDVPLAKIGGKGLFTKELDDLLLSGKIDLAVHSLKDVPIELPKGLKLACITKREDVRDCFLSHKFSSISTLPLNAKVGTTSLRRAMQLKALRQDICTLSLRGNVQTRLAKLDSGAYDAIILANAGLKRLGINHLAYMVPLEITDMIPAMGQAALGIECRESDGYLVEILGKLNDIPTSICTQAEREFVRTLDGGCQVPIGVHCAFVDETLSAESNEVLESALQEKKVYIEAIIGLPNGARFLRERICAKSSQAVFYANSLAQSFIAQGAKELLKEAMQFWDSFGIATKE